MKHSARQQKSFKTCPRFQCPEHQIYISPSTFEYPTDLDNLLWKDEADIALLQSIKSVKRESRMARERSEDALSWNVFRYLEKSEHLSAVLSCLLGRALGELQLVYWSYSPSFHSRWPELVTARKEFGEQQQSSSEFDLIVFNEKVVIFIEAKFTSGNKTNPSDPENQKKYVTGGGGWYRQVFASDYDTVTTGMYELMRSWLFGSWIAAQSGRGFYLVNLVRDKCEQDIEKRFGDHVEGNSYGSFVRMTWEKIYQYVKERTLSSPEKELLLAYFEHKTAGYKSGDRQLAFLIPGDYIKREDAG